MKRILSSILVIIFIINSLAFSTVATYASTYDDSDILTDNKYYYKSDYITTLGITAEQYISLVEMFETACKNHENYVNISSFGIPYSINTQKVLTDIIFNLYSAFDLFNGYYFSYNSRGITTIKLTYLYGTTQSNQMKEEIKAASNKILEGIIDNDTLSDYMKALIIHDRLIVNTEYQPTVLTSGYASDDDYSIYGALVLKKAVCEGYARAYSYLLGKAGIMSFLNRSDTLNHAWNIVYIDNKAYQVDCTWDDPTYDITGRVSHNNFLVSSNTLKKSHVADDFLQIAVDTSFETGYFWSSSNTQVVLLNNTIYYYDSTKAQLVNISNSQTVYSDHDPYWRTANGGYYTNNYTRIANDDKCIYISTWKSIYKYDPRTGEAISFYTPSNTGNGNNIYGFTADNGYFYIDVYSSPSFDSNTKNQCQQVYYYKTVCEHEFEYTCTITESTFTVKGTALYTCKNCGEEETQRLDYLVHWKSGDINNDSKVNSQDANLIIMIMLGLYGPDIYENDAADLNGDSRVNSVDANLISKAIVGQ